MWYYKILRTERHRGQKRLSWSRVMTRHIVTRTACEDNYGCHHEMAGHGGLAKRQYGETMKRILIRYRQWRINKLIIKQIKSLSDESIAHFNRKLPLVRHLEESKLNPQNFENLSPIPRHDISEFNKLITPKDIIKYNNHPNPKMEGSPYRKYTETTTSNYLTQYKTVFTNIAPPKTDTSNG